MSYQVLARKWRPQRFDDVVGQEAVTRTLRNAHRERAHRAGVRLCGLARLRQDDDRAHPGAGAELRQGTDAGSLRRVRRLRRDRPGARPRRARDRRGQPHRRGQHPRGRDRRPGVSARPRPLQGVHHRRGAPALDRVVQRAAQVDRGAAAARRLHDGDDRAAQDSRHHPVAFAGVRVPDDSTESHRRPASADRRRRAGRGARTPRSRSIARAAEGSMRDAQSALDQVIAFAGKTIGVDDVSTVLGLVGRDLLIDVIEAVVEEDGPRAFALADRAVESGTDLRLVCRELSQVVRDMMIMSVDPARVGDAELAADERERLTALAREFSREDLMRAFDLLSTAEQEIRVASHPRYHFEMVAPAVDAPRGSSCRWRIFSSRWVGLESGAVHRQQARRTASSSAPTTRPQAPHRRVTLAVASHERPQRRTDAYASHRRVASRTGVSGHRQSEGRPACRDPVGQVVLLQHRGGAGTEDRRHRRSRDVHVLARAPRAARAVRSVTAVARGGCRAAGRAQDHRRRRAGHPGRR